MFMHDKLIKPLNELLIADPFSPANIVGFTHILCLVRLICLEVCFMEFLVGGCSVGVEHVDGLEVFGASALADG